MRIAILGAGGGGASAVAELTQRGHKVTLWNRSAGTLQPFIEHDGVHYEGVLGEGVAQPEMIADDLARVIEDADGILVCVPTLAHASVAALLAEVDDKQRPVILNPGHTGGVFAFRQVFAAKGVTPPAVAEFSTLTYIARMRNPYTVKTTAANGRVWVAALPGGGAAMQIALALYPAARPAPDVLATALANVNMVLHPPGAILGAAWVEATGGDFTFYVQGLPPAVGRIMEQLDAERLAVAKAFGLDLPDLFAEMQAIGTIDAGADAGLGLAGAVRGGTANARIKAPDSLEHRYYREDFFYGLRPFLALAMIAAVEVPVARSLMALAERMLDPDGNIEGRSAAALGITGLDKQALLDMVRQ